MIEDGVATVIEAAVETAVEAALDAEDAPTDEVAEDKGEEGRLVNVDSSIEEAGQGATTFHTPCRLDEDVKSDDGAPAALTKPETTAESDANGERNNQQNSEESQSVEGCIGALSTDEEVADLF